MNAPHASLARGSLVKSLRFRLTLRNMAIVLLTVAITLVAVLVGLRFALLGETDQYLREDAHEMALAVENLYPDLDAIEDEMERKERGHRFRDLFVQLLDANDRVLLETDNTPDFDFPPTAAARFATLENYRITQYEAQVPGAPRMTVRVGSTLAQVHRDLMLLTQMILTVGALMLLVTPLMSYWLAGIATQPIRQISSAAARLRPDRIRERLPPRGTGDELDQLSQTINGLLDRIADYLQKNQEFVANAAHELRSPLAAIQSSVEVGLNVERTADEYQELLGEVIEECSRLRVLVNQLLLLAESDAVPIRAGAGTVDMSKVVSLCVEMFRGIAEESEIRLLWERPPQPLFVTGHELHLRQVVNNLIDNGIKFNRAGGEVRLALAPSADGKRIAFAVTDTGLGIPADDAPHIFERFYRGDRSRRRHDGIGGSGLGLSICHAIVTAHGGSIRLDASQNANRPGARFLVELPLAQ